MPEYLDVVYAQSTRTATSCPRKFAKHVVHNYRITPNARMLELGPGRGGFLAGFRDLGLECFGVELSTAAGKRSDGVPNVLANVDNSDLPFAGESFDVVFSKSLLEHLENPLTASREVFRVLRPGVRVIFKVPDWGSCWRVDFDDFTHKNPFCRHALYGRLCVSNFAEVRDEKFRQLRVVWKSRALRGLSVALGTIAPNRSRLKFLRWSKELMLLDSGVRPYGS